MLYEVITPEPLWWIRMVFHECYPQEPDNDRSQVEQQVEHSGRQIYQAKELGTLREGIKYQTEYAQL